MSLKDWNVDDYRTEYESEEHWELRKKFMQTYKSTFSEDELVCLAQVFVNVEFLGCRYPEETMRIVGELSQDVAKEFRENRAGKLKRTFVKASDAAEQKAKGKRLKGTKDNTFNITAILKATKISEDSNSDSDDNAERPSFSGARKKCENIHLMNNYWSSLRLDTNEKDNLDNSFFKFSNTLSFNSKPQAHSYCNLNLFSDLKYGNFIFLVTGDRSSLVISANKCCSKYEEKESVSLDGEKICEILLNNKIVSTGKGISAKIAKKIAFETALEIIDKECYSIKTKVNPEKILISKNNETITANIEISSEFSKLDSNNIGYKMMKKLGWGGGPLGFRTKGREEPIDCLTVKNNRKGFGSNTEEINATYFRKLLKNYTKSDDIRDLQFDSCFAKEDRAKLHQIATSKNLKSTSYGKGFTRYLVISKRNISPQTILNEILINKNPMYMNKYEVKVPVCKHQEFPKHTEFANY